MEWKVVVDIAPRIIPGTNGCHKFVYGYYRTMAQAFKAAEEINLLECAGKATVEMCQ